LHILSCPATHAEVCYEKVDSARGRRASDLQHYAQTFAREYASEILAATNPGKIEDFLRHDY
jgi:hypothetical protein